MSFSAFFKQLKKRLRLKRRWLTLGIWLLLIGVISTVVWSREHLNSSLSHSVMTSDARTVQGNVSSSSQSIEPSHMEHIMERIRASKGEREVFKQNNYVCGEEVDRLGRMDANAIVELHSKNPQWAVTINREGHVFFVEQVEDLSQHCKENAYFGIDKNGNLTLFEGMPNQEKVLRTFFQLNIEYLESSLPKETFHQLQEGIRVTDLAEFNSVLSTFSDFAVEETEKVMKPS